MYKGMYMGVYGCIFLKKTKCILMCILNTCIRRNVDYVI